MIRKVFVYWLVALLPGAAAAATLSVPLSVQEAICAGCLTGVPRTNEPFTVGVPIPDSAGLTTTSGLGLTGSSAAQFSVEASWPSGNIKWLKVRGILPSLSAGGTATVTLTDGGSGNFGGVNLATDNGSTITVSTNGGTCGSDTAICFTIRKANYNVLDQVQIGSTTLVSSGASQGLVVLGPDPTAAFPGNVTCSPTTGGTACTTVYSTTNDAASTCSIEENGPAAAVVKCAADLKDGAGHTYMRTTTRLYFWNGKSYVKATAILQNADLGTGNTFASATKGHQGFELRLTPKLTGLLTYTIANDSGNTTGTLDQSGGTDYAYLYQAESNTMKPNGWCGAGCVPFSPISGYAIVSNGTATRTGTAAQYPTGWADVSDTSGNGVVIGQEFFAGYGNKSLEFRGGGTDVRLGLWAAENNTTSPSTTTANAPYYQAWPQYSIHNVWMEFHTSAPASPANDFLSFQYPLIARAAISWYNSASVFPFPLLDPTEEQNYYNAALGSASPAVALRTPSDSTLGSTASNEVTCEKAVCVTRWWNWKMGGGGNQMEFRLSHLYNWIRRGYTGGYLQSANWYKWAAESAFPRSDGFKWSQQGAMAWYYNYPVNVASKNGNLTSTNTNLWMQADFEHANAQGIDTYYLMSGDETIKEAILNGPVDMLLDTTSVSNYTTAASSLWNDRAIGNLFKWAAHLYIFLNSIGDPADANAILKNAETVYTVRLQPDLCAYPGYPAGCVPDGTDSQTVNANLQLGTSSVRGVSHVFREEMGGVDAACSGILSGSNRAGTPFMSSRKLEGMIELFNVLPPTWPYYNQFWDNMYGTTQWAFDEMFVDDGTNVWTNNGFRYREAVDGPNACNDGPGKDFSVHNDQTIWYHWTIQSLYTGSTSSRQLNFNLQRDSGANAYDEFFHDTIATAIYYILHPPNSVLATIPLLGFTDNGGGSYTLSWTTPPNATSYRIKWGRKKIVDWIGFDASTYKFKGDPTATQNWFASSDVINPPVPGAAGSPQVLTVNTGVPGLAAANFMVKAYTTTSAAPAPPPTTTTAPPSVSLTAPAPGATVAGTVTISATASAAVGAPAVQFQLDGANLGSAITAPGPYNLTWKTTTVTDGPHTLTAIAFDAAGNSRAASPISVTVSNSVVPDGGPPLKTWTKLTPAGPPVMTLGYDKSVYVSSRSLHCQRSAYHESRISGSEPNDAIACYSYQENRWFILQNSGAWHTGHTGSAGHTEGIWTYIPDKDVIAYQSDGSGNLVPEQFPTMWWWYDVGGLSGQLRQMPAGYWQGTVTTSAAMAYDTSHHKLVLFPDANGLLEICDPDSNTCEAPVTSGPTPPVASSRDFGFAYNAADQKIYAYINTSNVYTFDVGTKTWTLLSPTCSGADCTSGRPPARVAAGWAYSSKDNIFLMAGGAVQLGGALLSDTWSFDPVAVSWTEQTPSAKYAIDGLTSVFDRLTYDEQNNVFVMMAGTKLNPVYSEGTYNYYNTAIFVYPYSAALPYGTGGKGYTPSSGSLNRVDPNTTNPQICSSLGGSCQSWAFSPTVASAGNTLYAGWIETGAQFDTSTCGSAHHPYIQSTQDMNTWTKLPGGTPQSGACASIDPENGSRTDSSNVHIAVVNGTLWQVHEKSSSGNTTIPSTAWAGYWTGTGWTSAQIGCLSGKCSSGNAGIQQYPAALIASGDKPTVALIEENNAPFVREFYLRVAQWDSSSKLWSALGGKLNINGTGTRSMFAALSTDGTNPAACWAEEVVNGQRSGAIMTTPQIQCAQWDGSSSWVPLGNSSLNRDSANYASEVAMTYAGGHFYTAWIERPVDGNANLYACRWDGSTCTMLGSGSLNTTTATGWAAHPSLTTDGSNVYLGWEEQAALGQRSLGHVKIWDGSNWSLLGGAIVADPANGSVEGVTLTTLNGAPVAIWGEMTYGTLRQIYMRQWTNGAWVGLGNSSTQSTCDLNGDGLINVLDVQSAINQSLGKAPCTTADLKGTGQCDAIDVQRVINASLGGACVVGQ